MKKLFTIVILFLFLFSNTILAGSSKEYFRSMLYSAIESYENGNLEEALGMFEMCGNQHNINRYADICRTYIPNIKKMIADKAIEEHFKLREEKKIADEKEYLKKQQKQKKVAKEKRLADEKAAKEKRIADEKAAKEKKLADEKAAKEKKLADEKAAKEKKLTDEKAAEEKRIAKEIRDKELSLIIPETELEVAQQFLENIKAFIKLYPNEFDTIKVFEFIIITKPIKDGNLNFKLKEDLKLFVEFTKTSDKFFKYSDNIEKKKIEIKLSKIKDF